MSQDALGSQSEIEGEVERSRSRGGDAFASLTALVLILLGFFFVFFLFFFMFLLLVRRFAGFSDSPRARRGFLEPQDASTGRSYFLRRDPLPLPRMFLQVKAHASSFTSVFSS